jgi:23S rRNA pseudouridine1911/1915/1917 synthase
MGDLNIIYEDNHLIAVIKEPGVLSQSDGRAVPDLLTIVRNHIKDKYKKPGKVYLALLHRLDMPVSGIMVFAKTSKAAKRMNEQIRRGGMEKRYLAVVTGRPKEPLGRLEGFILKDAENNKSRMCSSEEPGAKYAALEYSLVSESECFSLLDIRLITGRSHQIRVQMADMGNPIAGDRKYGSDKSHHTTALFAWALVFKHPVTKEEIRLAYYPRREGIFNKFKYEELIDYETAGSFKIRDREDHCTGNS